MVLGTHDTAPLAIDVEDRGLGVSDQNPGAGFVVSLVKAARGSVQGSWAQPGLMSVQSRFASFVIHALSSQKKLSKRKTKRKDRQYLMET